MVEAVIFAAVYGNWPTWGADLQNTGLQLMKGAMSGAPSLKWNLATGAAIEWQNSAVDDLDGDGVPEVIFATTNGLLYCVDGSTGSVQWTFQFASDTDTVDYDQRCSPTVADLDGDGAKEVVFGSHLNPTGVYCLDSSGALKWYTPLAPILTGAPVADLDGDGVLEVIVSYGNSLQSDTDTVYAIDGATGTVEWKFPAVYVVAPTPAVEDLDGDGEYEVVFSASNGNSFPSEDRLYCVSGVSGAEKWEIVFENPVSSPTIGDVDGDGQPEVVALAADSSGMVVVVDAQGNIERYTKLEVGSVVIWPFGVAKPALADVDGDGIPEIIAAYSGTHCIDGASGAILWQYPEGNRHPPAVADLDGDGQLEVLISKRTGEDTLADTLIALNAENGTELWKVAFSTWKDLHSPIVADIDNDDCVEVLLGTWKPDTSNESVFFALDDPSGSADCGALSAGEGPEVKRIPLIKGSVSKILLDLPGSGRVCLSLYDVSGKVVKTLWDGYAPSGRYSFSVNLRPGVYIASLRFEGKVYSQRLLVK